MSDGETNPVSPLTNPKGARDASLNPASDLESDLHSHNPSLEAPRLGLALRGGDRVKDRSVKMTMQGSELKAIREGLGWGQRKFAAEIGMTQSYIGLMERGEKPIERRTELAARYLALKGEDA